MYSYAIFHVALKYISCKNQAYQALGLANMLYSEATAQNPSIKSLFHVSLKLDAKLF